jgi:hypothetical protein
MTHRDPSSAALLDALVDLEHDLAKYLRLPFAFLPQDAPPGDVRKALHEALVSTRRTTAGTRSAADIWCGFTAEMGEFARGPRFDALSFSVARVLAWARAVDDEDAQIDRHALEEHIADVKARIAAWRDDLEAR